ncbi:MAG TPA: hypothetical protein VJ813_12835 [Vicinamibacterales bacterium]|nr:hypothetical protein [Vicinamibacterales bacterium]
MHSTSLLAVVLFAAVLAPAESVRQADQESPAITLDFLVTSPDADAPADLTAADVVLKVGGKVRPLTSLELVAPADGRRNILLLVDEATLFALEPVVKEAVSKLVASLLPGDRIAYVSTRRGRVTPLTLKHEAATASLEAMVTGPGILHTCLSDMLTSIRTLARTLPRGRATTLAVISRGSPYDPTFGTDSGAGCTPRKDVMREVEEVISAAQINLHLLTADHASRSWGLDTLAGNIGGLPGLLTWANATALERAVASTSRYYRATFAADPTAPPRPQRVDLRVNRPKVKIRTSPTIEIFRRAATGGGAATGR